MTTLPAGWRAWPLADQQALLERMRVARRRQSMVLSSVWRRSARPDQLPPDEDWRTIFWRGGRGSGKTRAAAEEFAAMLARHPPNDDDGNEWAIVAPTFGAARDVCIEGDSGVIRALGGRAGGGVLIDKGPLISAWNRSMGQLYLVNGTVVYADGANDGAPRIQGKNLRGIWGDELGMWLKWRTAWDESIFYAVRKRPARKIVTGTPKRAMPAIALVKRLIADPKVVNRRLRTEDNADNLAPEILDELMATRGTALGAQELEGEVLDEAEGALWTRDPSKAEREMLGLIVSVNGVLDVDAGSLQLEDGRTIRLGRRVVALDPAEGSETGDEQGLAAAALGHDGVVYVLHAWGQHVAPMKWLTGAVDLYDRLRADVLVMEKNGAMGIKELLGQQFPWVNMTTVWAQQNKRTRAEPVQGRYVKGRVVHVTMPGNDLSELEGQMTAFTGEPGEESPGQLDSLVWALSDLFQLGGPARSHPVAHERLDRPAALTAPEPDGKRRRPANVML